MQGAERSGDEAPLPPSGVDTSVGICNSADEMCEDPCVAQCVGPPAQPMLGPILKDWVPPRGGEIAPTLYTGESGTRPAGGALPPLLPPPIHTMEDHVNFATILDPI